MKPSGEGLTAKPRKGASQAAAVAPLAEDTLASAHVKVDGIPGKRAVEVKRRTGGKHERQAGVLVAFAGSGVTAHDAVMKGVPGRALTRIWESTRGSLPAEAILKAIGVSARTAHRIKTDPDKPLDARTTDGIYRLESVRTMAGEVLGSAEAANEWLNTEAMGLEFRKPIDLVSTSPGAEAVKTLLQRMKYGVYVLIPLPASLGGSGAVAGWTLQDARHAVTWNSGTGSATYGGRWNSIGKHVIYAALDPATAILEVAVHKGFKVLNTVAHSLYSFTITDPAQVRVVQPGDVPNPHWLHPIPPNKDQQKFGDQLIDAHPYVLLPSAVSGHSWNLLVNVETALPLMADIQSERFALDPRLRAKP